MEVLSIEQFLDSLWLERGLSKNTLDSYRHDLTLVNTYLTTQKVTLNAASATHLNDYFNARLEGKIDYKNTSTARLMSAIRRYYQYLCREDSLHLIKKIPQIPSHLNLFSRNPRHQKDRNIFAV